MKNKLILALSGNDIYSGGGLYADLATYTVHGLHGFVAVTCLTAMTDKGFEVLPTDEQVFAQQLSSLKDVPFSAIKLGLLPTVATFLILSVFWPMRQQLWKLIGRLGLSIVETA